MIFSFFCHLTEVFPCPLVRMPGDVSPKMLNVLASYLWAASRICHALLGSVLPG